MPKAEHEMKPIQIRCSIDPKTKTLLEQWTKLAGRTEHFHSGILLQRLCRLYEKNPAILLKLGMIAHSEHPDLAAKLEVAVA